MLPKPSSSATAPLRASERRAQQLSVLRWQAKFRTIALLFIIIITWFLDKTWWHSALMIPKGVALGAGLNWLIQSVFTWFVFRLRGPQAQQLMTQQLYLGQIVKWAVMLVGFSLIFTVMQPISTGGVISGFMAMQLIYFLGLWKLR